jgi:hypothetical protein
MTDRDRRLRLHLLGTPFGALRDIDPPLSVPWTPLQWAIVLALTAFLAWVIRRAVRFGAARRQQRPLTFDSLRRELESIDRQRLERRLSNTQAVISVAQVVRHGLRLADVRRGGTGSFRTTREWHGWCDTTFASDRAARESVDAVLTTSDGIQFCSADPSLDQTRSVIDSARSVIDKLAGAAAVTSADSADEAAA